jgi:hypothetical protein
MPTKPAKRATLEPQELYDIFKNAFETYTKYMEAQNYIGAAVVAFSILEDRVKAMYIVRKRQQGKAITKGYTSFGNQLKYLLEFKDIDKTTLDIWKASADKRNELFHEAMLNPNAFDAEVCKNFLKQARAANKARRNQKKTLGI